MNATTPKKSRRKLTALELSAPARGALRRLKRDHGMSFTHAVERGLKLVEQVSVIGEQMPAAAAREAVGLSPLPLATNRRKAVAK